MSPTTIPQYKYYLSANFIVMISSFIADYETIAYSNCRNKNNGCTLCRIKSLITRSDECNKSGSKLYRNEILIFRGDCSRSDTTSLVIVPLLLCFLREIIGSHTIETQKAPFIYTIFNIFIHITRNRHAVNKLVQTTSSLVKASLIIILSMIILSPSPRFLGIYVRCSNSSPNGVTCLRALKRPCSSFLVSIFRHRIS